MLCNLTLAFDSSLRIQLPINRFSSLVSLEPRSPFSITEENSYVEKMGKDTANLSYRLIKPDYELFHNRNQILVAIHYSIMTT